VRRNCPGTRLRLFWALRLAQPRPPKKILVSAAAAGGPIWHYQRANMQCPVQKCGAPIAPEIRPLLPRNHTEIATSSPMVGRPRRVNTNPSGITSSGRLLHHWRTTSGRCAIWVAQDERQSRGLQRNLVPVSPLHRTPNRLEHKEIRPHRTPLPHRRGQSRTTNLDCRRPATRRTPRRTRQDQRQT